jgi:hypothetical protein
MEDDEDPRPMFLASCISFENTVVEYGDRTHHVPRPRTEIPTSILVAAQGHGRRDQPIYSSFFHFLSENVCSFGSCC